MAKTKFKQIRLKKVPIDVHTKIKGRAVLSHKTLEDCIIDILKIAATK